MDPETNRYILMNESKGLVPGYPQSMLDTLGKSNIAAVHGSTHRHIRAALLSLLCASIIRSQLLPKLDDFMRCHLRNWDNTLIDIQQKTKEMAFLSSLNQIASIEWESMSGEFMPEFSKLVLGTLSLPINFPGTNYHRGFQVEQRRKEALSRTGEESQSALESSLQDVVSRYSFMDLWPCSSKDLDHLARQEWLSKNVNKKTKKSAQANGAVFVDRGSSGLTTNSNQSTKVVYPDTSRMVIYDPRQKAGPSAPGLPAVSSTLTASSVVLTGGGTPNAPNEFLKATPPALLAFIENLPAVEGPAPDIDFVLSICLQSNIPTGQTGKSVNPSTQLQTAPAPSTSDLSGSSKPHPVPSGSSFKTTRDRKRRDADS